MSQPGSAQKHEVPKIGVIEKYALPYYTACFQHICIWIIYLTTDQPAFTLAFVLLFPYMGKFLPKDSYPVLNSVQHNKGILHVLPLVAHIFCTWITLTKFFIDFPLTHYNVAQIPQAIITLLFAITPSIDTSHQLMHRPQKIFQILGFINMSIFQFTVYPIQHIQLHHKMVGTDKDPITSPKNRSFYYFVLNAYFSAHKFAFKHNLKQFFVCIATNFAYIALLGISALREGYGPEDALLKVAIFVGFGLAGFMLFEAGEYIQHYGLIYRKEKDQKPINEICSWNSDHNIINNWLMFRFQRHSDHHMNAFKVYSTLELTQKMPKFPFNFYQGAYIAFIPPLWFFVMNPYVDQVIEGKPLSKQHEKIVFYIKEVVGLIVVGLVLWAVFQAFQMRQLIYVHHMLLKNM